jgi:hypothetical protein
LSLAVVLVDILLVVAERVVCFKVLILYQTDKHY